VQVVPLTEEHPVQPPKLEPTAAAAVTTAVVPDVKDPLQADPLQLTPAVVLESVPVPEPLATALKDLVLVWLCGITKSVIELAAKVAVNPSAATAWSSSLSMAAVLVELYRKTCANPDGGAPESWTELVSAPLVLLIPITVRALSLDRFEA
jgi:hypothetical protein